MKRVLIIAGSDSGGGAGIQADIKTATALGVFATTAITAVTVQNTRTVSDIHPVPANIVSAQIKTVLDDIGADAVKIGMLGTADTIKAVAGALNTLPKDVPIVLDPVLVATSGDTLASGDVRDTLIGHMLPHATLLTPNRPEAETLTGVSIATDDEGLYAAQKLLEMGPKAVLLKGGHGTGPSVRDLLLGDSGTTIFEHERLDTTNTHGTGCTLSTAIAVYLAQGCSLAEAVDHAGAYVLTAIRTAPGLGGGHGPLNHLHTLKT